MQNNIERGTGIVSLLLFNIPHIGLLAQERLGKLVSLPSWLTVS